MILGLKHIHKQGIIYRDLKSDNVLLFSLDPNRAPCVKLTDYGIAGEDLPGGARGLSGTPGFQAPEILLMSVQSAKVPIVFQKNSKLSNMRFKPKTARVGCVGEGVESLATYGVLTRTYHHDNQTSSDIFNV